MTLAEKIIMEGTIAYDNQWVMIIHVGKDIYKLQWDILFNRDTDRNRTRSSRVIKATKFDKKHKTYIQQPDYIRDALMIVAWPRIGFDDMG
jgi:hypothetical protein